MKILLCWLGLADLKAISGSGLGPGPIACAAKERDFDKVYILSDHSKQVTYEYKEWLAKQFNGVINIVEAFLTRPTDYNEIYKHSIAAINEIYKKHGGIINLAYHLSPGTPAMAAVWIILAKTKYPAELIESSIAEGVKTVDFPFDIAADYLSDKTSLKNDKITLLAQGLPPESPDFEAIIHKCKTMKRAIVLARRLAIHEVNVLLSGESGTGKELFARAIHSGSNRRNKPFISVNCGAIPSELVEAEFFGHVKGAFTGAIQQREGYFESANGGTIFLDEVSELPLNAQVKLLRTIQDGTIQKIGIAKPKFVDIRVIAATNRDLINEVAGGRFREDLFHRLAVGVITLPPLREREGDLNLLIDHFLSHLNLEFSKSTDGNPWKLKKLSAGARNLLIIHSWPGNVRELLNTLSRAMIWTAGDTIQKEDVQEAFLPSVGNASKNNILNYDFGSDFSLPSLMGEVAVHYLEKALTMTRGNKSEAARLLGLTNYQTLTNWIKKYGVKI